MESAWPVNISAGFCEKRKDEIWDCKVTGVCYNGTGRIRGSDKETLGEEQEADKTVSQKNQGEIRQGGMLWYI